MIYLLRNSALFLSITLLLRCGATTEEKATPTQEPQGPSLEEMIGQMVMIGFRGIHFSEVSDTIREQIQAKQVGGIILFDYDLESKKAVRNIANPKQVKGLIDSLQQLVPQKLLMAVDQEGGRVNRLKSKYGFPTVPSAKHLGDLDNLDTTQHYARINANNLRSLGFNVNFSPVVDVDLNPNNPVIGGIERSYGDHPDKVIKHASSWINSHSRNGILSTLKHFPGHGSSSGDSHEGFTDVSTLWQQQELLPFRELSKLDASVAIMTAHVFNNKLDSLYPATLSEKIIKGIIRDQWKFNGIVFSDDLQMGAVNKLYDFETIIKRSILAGVDILVFGNNLKYDEQIPIKAAATIKTLIEKGEISEDRIRVSYERVMALKERLK